MRVHITQLLLSILAALNVSAQVLPAQANSRLILISDSDPLAYYSIKRKWFTAFRLAHRTVYLGRAAGSPDKPAEGSSWVVTIFDAPTKMRGTRVVAVVDGETFDCEKKTVRFNVRVPLDTDGVAIDANYLSDYEPLTGGTLARAKLQQLCSDGPDPTPPAPSSIKELVGFRDAGPVGLPQQDLVPYEPKLGPYRPPDQRATVPKT